MDTGDLEAELHDAMHRAQQQTPGVLSVSVRHRSDGSSMQFTIHEASRADFDTLPAGLLTDSARHAAASSWCTSQRPPDWILLSIRIDDAHAGLLVAQLTAVSPTYGTPQIPPGEDDFHIACCVHCIYVRPEHRNIGAADKLWTYLRRNLKKRQQIWGIVAVGARASAHAGFFTDRQFYPSPRWPGDLISESESTPRRCNTCGCTARQRCAGCGHVFYCGAQCQRLDWIEGHKGACRRLNT